MCVASGCGCKEVYRYYLSLLLLNVLFLAAASLLFWVVHLKKLFFVLVTVYF